MIEQERKPQIISMLDMLIKEYEKDKESFANSLIKNGGFNISMPAEASKGRDIFPFITLKLSLEKEELNYKKVFKLEEEMGK